MRTPKMKPPKYHTPEQWAKGRWTFWMQLQAEKHDPDCKTVVGARPASEWAGTVESDFPDTDQDAPRFVN